MAAVHPSAYAQLKSVRSVLSMCTYHVNTLMWAHVGSHERQGIDVFTDWVLPCRTACATSKRAQEKPGWIQAAYYGHKHCQSLVSPSLAAAFQQAVMVETSKVVPFFPLGRQ